MQEANDRLSLCLSMRLALKRELACLVSDQENPSYCERQIAFAELAVTRAVLELERLKLRFATLPQQIEQRQSQILAYSQEIAELTKRGAVDVASKEAQQRRDERQREKIRRAAEAKDKRKKALLERFKQLQDEANRLESKGVNE